MQLVIWNSGEGIRPRAKVPSSKAGCEDVPDQSDGSKGVLRYIESESL